MKSRKAIGLVAVGLVSLLLVGCGGGADPSEEPEYQLSPVLRGDLTVEVTSSGNLLYAGEAELSFDVAGTIGEVRVEVGDVVEEGQLLARIDADEWQDHLGALEDKVEATVRAVETAEKGVTNAERGLTSAERKLESAQSSLLQTDISLRSAELALKNAEEAPDWKQDEDDLDIKALQVELAEMRLAESQNSLLDAEQSVADAAVAVIEAEEAVADALQAQDDAERELAEARGTNTMVVAPFDGIVTSVSAAAYDAVKKGHTVIVVSDPTTFEATMLVNEIDILKVQVGATALIEIDALPGTSLPARVTAVAPAASAQQGVVNYRVTAELLSLEALAATPPEQTDAEPAGGSDIDEALDRAVANGQLTQQAADVLKERFVGAGLPISAEQLEQLIERFGSGAGLGRGALGQGQNLTQEQLDALRDRFGGGGQGSFGQRFQEGLAAGQLAGGLDMAGVQLREGLSVTVRIITQQRNDALLVPNQAIMSQGQVAFVEMLVDGVVEPRQITAGVNDWQYTEVLDGLSEGEQVIVGRTSTNDSEPTQQQGGFGLFGGGGPGRIR
jgi:multidrug resistance efflux pump